MEGPADDPERESHVARAIVQPAHAGAIFDAARWQKLRPRLVTTIGYAAPALAALALVLVLAGEGVAIDDDLQLIAPASAMPGERLPLRARLYTQLRAIEGPALRKQPIEIVLESATGGVLGRTQLRPARGRLPDLEGELSVPNYIGTLRIRGQAAIDGRTIRVATWLRVVNAVPRIAPDGRSLRVLQQFSEGAVVVEPNAVAPAALQVRVRGGACVPEQPCRALVHMDVPAAALRLEPNSTLTPSAASQRASESTSGVVGVDFVTHGPEAELWLIVERQGQRVARRAVRLPVAMGALALQTRALTWSAEARPVLRALASEGACIVDAFRNGHWVRTASLAACDAEGQVPWAALPAGSYRLQVRDDRFSAQTAGVAAAYVRTPGESATQTVSALAREAHEFEPGDRFVAECLAAPSFCQDRTALEYLAAVLETGIIEAPPAATGYADTLTGLRERQARLRNLSLLALALGGLSLALRIGQRGLAAGARARTLLLRDSLDPEFGRRTRARTLLLVSASVISLVLVFVVIALYVLARGGQ